MAEPQQDARRLFDESPVGLALVQGGEVIRANASFRAVVGPGELGTAVHPDDRHRLRALLEDAGSDHHAIIRWRHAGGERWTRCRRQRLTDGGEEAQVVLSIEPLEDRDATARIVAQQDREASMIAFAGGLAHDFNNILVSVLSGASMLQDELPPEPRFVQLCDMIVDGAEKMAELTGKLLSYSGGTIFRPGPTRLGDVVQQTLLGIKVPSDVDLKIELDETLPPLHGDARQLENMLHAVITNAIEALAGRPGHVWVSTRFEPNDSFESADAVLIVRDDGPGMSADVQERIFEPFFTTRFQGRGLGLAAAAGILKAHGAQVQVQSGPGGGARFEFRFPVDLASTRPRRRQRDGADLKRLLVIDDDHRVRRVMRRVLKQAGYETTDVASGLEAIELVQQGSEFDAMVVDIFMPDMKGDEVIRRMRALRPTLPIVVCSGYGQEQALADVETGVVQEFIMKPFRNDAFLAAVERTVSSLVSPEGES